MTSAGESPRPVDHPATLTPRRIRRLAIAAACLALATWAASWRMPTGPATGTGLNSAQGGATSSAGVASRAPGRVRLGTFNIHGGKDRYNTRDLDRTAASLHNLELVGLNEVHGAYFWERADQAQILGETLGMDWLFAPAERRWGHYDFGNGLLCRLPVTGWQRIPLPRRHGRSFRNVLLVNVDIGGSPLRVLIVHVDRSDDRERREQLRSVGDLFLSLAEPAVLMGDMNTTSDEPGIARLLAAPGVHDPLLDATGESPARIDWLLTRGLRTVDAGVVDEGASDHPHIWAEVELGPSGVK